ncbi:ankyrin repeat domain-containing protein [Aquimarina litoralis]|uniref:ankyrin repeat domain-containing protein n=1 Tax=Aquimarina litoralis TaxID=584605 RepID=UPI001C55D933|nr:ankyrin repeat domain-containing protein [Aquimarina litoralis]MBW1294283.1 ankyrin repeat domain-containing protein [Aquimarina litoralis]
MRTTILTVLMMIFIGSINFAKELPRAIDIQDYEVVNNKMDPFFMAVIKGDFDTVVKMIEEGSDVNLRIDGKTPLMYAARYNRADIVRLLIGKGAYISAKDNNGNTAMKFAESANAQEAIKVLKEMS